MRRLTLSLATTLLALTAGCDDTIPTATGSPGRDFRPSTDESSRPFVVFSIQLRSDAVVPPSPIAPSAAWGHLLLFVDGAQTNSGPPEASYPAFACTPPSPIVPDPTLVSVQVCGVIHNPGLETFDLAGLYAGVAGTVGRSLFEEDAPSHFPPEPCATVHVGGTFQISATEAAALLADPAAFYVQLATTEHPAGALRGQLFTPPNPVVPPSPVAPSDLTTPPNPISPAACLIELGGTRA